MSDTYLNQTELAEYDSLLKLYINSDKTVAYKTVLKSADGLNLLFFKKPNATLSDTPDKQIPIEHSVELTQEEYDALPTVKKQDGTVYYITDGEDMTYLVLTIEELLAGTATNWRSVRADFMNQGIKALINELHTFTLSTSSWVANEDASTSTDYPYIYNISSNLYTDDSRPIWDLDGAGVVPTAIERESIDMILEAIFSTTGIKLYASGQPTSNLTLRVKGV